MSASAARRRWAILAAAVAAALVVALSSLMVAAYTAPPSPSSMAGTGVAGAAVCATLETSASLNASVAVHYPNASLLPSTAVAQSNLLNAWAAICGSAAFAAGYGASANPQVTEVLHVQDQNRTSSGDLIGSLFARFTLGWNAPCPTGAGPYPVGYACAYADLWDTNLSTGAWEGPTASITSARFVQCDTPTQNQSDVAAVQGYYQSGSIHPTEAVAVSEVMTIWGTVCASLPYVDALAAHPNATTSWGTSVGPSGNGSSGGNPDGGVIDFEWDISWNAACPANSSEYTGDALCEYTDAWTANLATNTSTGPTLEVFPPTDGAPQYVPPSAASSSAAWWTVPAYVLPLALAVVAVGAGLWWMVLRPRSGAGSPPPKNSAP